MGWITVSSPIFAVGEIAIEAFLKGLKCAVSLLKSLKGSSESNKAFPLGHSTSLFINTIVAFDCKALS